MAKINDKFKRLIPPLQADERKQLEASIIAEGVRDAIVVWLTADEDTGEEVRIIVDGHNRHEICKANGIECPEVVKHFDNEADVMKWMILNQFGRRNISTYQRGVLALELEGLFAEDAKRRQIEAGEIGRMHGHEGGRGNKKDKPLVENSPQGVIEEQKDTVKKTREHLAEIAGVSDNTITRIKTIEAKADDETKAKLQAGEMSVNEAYKAVKEKEKKEQRQDYIEQQKKEIEEGAVIATEGLFDVISIDPPWPYGREYDPNGSRVANPYPEMSIGEIKKIELPLKSDAVIFLWTTHAFLPDAFDILKTWNATYKATMVWNKKKIGMGAWFRMQCEFCLVGIIGKPFWNNTRYPEIIEEARREHSRKPDAFFDLVDSICAGRKLEYFSREKRQNWENYGNEPDKF